MTSYSLIVSKIGRLASFLKVQRSALESDLGNDEDMLYFLETSLILLNQGSKKLKTERSLSGLSSKLSQKNEMSARNDIGSLNHEIINKSKAIYRSASEYPSHQYAQTYQPCKLDKEDIFKNQLKKIIAICTFCIGQSKSFERL